MVGSGVRASGHGQGGMSPRSAAPTTFSCGTEPTGWLVMNSQPREGHLVHPRASSGCPAGRTSALKGQPRRTSLSKLAGRADPWACHLLGFPASSHPTPWVQPGPQGKANAFTRAADKDQESLRAPGVCRGRPRRPDWGLGRPSAGPRGREHLGLLRQPSSPSPPPQPSSWCWGSPGAGGAAGARGDG